MLTSTVVAWGEGGVLVYMLGMGSDADVDNGGDGGSATTTVDASTTELDDEDAVVVVDDNADWLVS